MAWILFTTACVLLLRHYIFHNVDLMTFVWLIFGFGVIGFLNALFSERVIYHIMWVILFMTSGKRHLQRYKDAYGDHGGDYDAP